MTLRQKAADSDHIPCVLIEKDTPLAAFGINGDIAGTLDASYYKGCGERQGIEREVVCVKRTEANELSGNNRNT